MQSTFEFTGRYTYERLIETMAVLSYPSLELVLIKLQRDAPSTFLTLSAVTSLNIYHRIKNRLIQDLQSCH